MATTDPDRPHRRRRGGAWRWGTPIVAGLCGAMFWTSYSDAGGIEWRPQRYTDLAALVEDQNDEVVALNNRSRELTEEIDRLTAQVDNRRVQQARSRERGLQPAAGLTPVTGPGVTVTLSDSPDDVRESSELNENLFVVHQQDIQRVVNAMWQGGASAITIQGQRIVTTTGIKCEGNAVQLQGIAYPQPYVIQAIGEQSRILGSLESDDYLANYRDQSKDARVEIGWDLETQSSATAPAYDGPLAAQYARTGS